ncbi:hypothetical protein AB0R12_27520, partial [Streptomyces niveus]|uniref:hypothetical protein n=1 Tax=Streptomyces niveus TaxID=193462 RepID=UPI0034128CBC
MLRPVLLGRAVRPVGAVHRKPGAVEGAELGSGVASRRYGSRRRAVPRTVLLASRSPSGLNAMASPAPST